MGGNLGIENVKQNVQHKGNLSPTEETSLAKFKKSSVRLAAKHGVIATASGSTTKPCVTRWNSKESPFQLPEEKCVGNLRLISFFSN